MCLLFLIPSKHNDNVQIRQASRVKENPSVFNGDRQLFFVRAVKMKRQLFSTKEEEEGKSLNTPRQTRSHSFATQVKIYFRKFGTTATIPLGSVLFGEEKKQMLAVQDDTSEQRSVTEK